MSPIIVPGNHITFVLGGARSGKSRHAEALVMLAPRPGPTSRPRQACDEEMRARIAAHRAGRAAGWVTIEAPLELAAALGRAGPVLVDCLTLWLTNLVLAERDPAAAADGLLAALDGRDGPTVLVSNEVGLGIVPDNALSRRFRDAAGVLHQRVAARADEVVLVVAGLAVKVK